jgi:hypothetical protein
MPHPCHATTMQFWKRLLKATPQRDMVMALHCELSSAVQRRHVGDLPAFGSFRLPSGVPGRLFFTWTIPVHYTVGRAVWIFPATTRTFTKDTALSENGRARHGLCELTRDDMTG